MSAIQTALYSMPAGDTRSLPISIPASIYTTGSTILFGMKLALDSDLTDAKAVVKKTLTDANITSQTALVVNYLMTLGTADTNQVTANTYYAGFKFVSEDETTTVISYPDPSISILKWQITNPVNNRL